MLIKPLERVWEGETSWVDTKYLTELHMNFLEAGCDLRHEKRREKINVFTHHQTNCPQESTLGKMVMEHFGVCL